MAMPIAYPVNINPMERYTGPVREGTMYVEPKEYISPSNPSKNAGSPATIAITINLLRLSPAACLTVSFF
jgi:hypothetical protein